IREAERELELLNVIESPIRIYETALGPQVFACTGSGTRYLCSFSQGKYGDEAMPLAEKARDACERALRFALDNPQQVREFIMSTEALEPVEKESRNIMFE